MRNFRQAFADNGALTWAAAAVLAGCALLFVMGAPARMPLMNGAAFFVGLALLGVVQASQRLGASARHADWALFAAALLLPATALTGPAMDGVSRWLVVAGITIQPSLIVTPLLALALAARHSVLRLGAVAVASAGLAMQPDPGGAAMLFLGLSAPLALRSGRGAIAAIAAALAAAALAISIARTVALPPVPFVEQVLAQAAAQGPVPALLAALAIAFLFLPARTGSRPVAHAFAATWAAGLAASLLGPYPTPVVGFGGSAVLGYVLSVGLLIAIGDKKAMTAKSVKARDGDKDNANLRFA